MYNHSLFYNHLTLPIFGRNKTGHFDNRWEMLYYEVGGSFSLWAPVNTHPPVYLLTLVIAMSGLVPSLPFPDRNLRKSEKRRETDKGRGSLVYICLRE